MRRVLAAGVVAVAVAWFGGGACASPEREPSDRMPTVVEDRPRHYHCQYALDRIVVDGRLDDAAWQAADWTDWFVDIEGSAKPAPRHATRMKMLWDSEHLYIGASLAEPHVSAKLTEHDAIVYHDNDFEAFIDPDGDAKNYFEVEINALNTIFDLLLVRTYLDGGPAVHEWDVASLRSAIQVDGTLNDPSDVDRSWTLEMALPWHGLEEYANRPLPPRHGHVWRMNFSRVEWQTRIVDGAYVKVPDTREDNWVWSPQGTINMHIPQRWGYVRFVGPRRTARPAPARDEKGHVVR